MAKKIYIGVGNQAKNVKTLYVGVNNVAKKVEKVYVGVNGQAKLVYEAFTNPLNTDQLTLGQHDVYFTEYPDLKWCVDHLDGDYAYLGLYNCTEKTMFRNSGTTYSGSTIATKCTTFLNNTIPNVADYLEDVTINGVTNKVFIPSYKMFSGTASTGDANDPTFDWSSASRANRVACISNWSTISNAFWLSSPTYSNIWSVDSNGGFYNGRSPEVSIGFRPEVKVRYKITPFINPLNTDQLTLGDGTIYFTRYPDLKWQVQHLDGDYVYLSLTEMTELTTFGSNSAYAGSTIAQKCTDFLNNTIPDVSQYLENVTVNGVTNKVFIPSYKMFSRTAAADGGDANDPIFSWPRASGSNRVCNYQGSAEYYWLSSPFIVSSTSGSVWFVNKGGSFGAYSPTNSIGFRPCVKVRYKERL